MGEAWHRAAMIAGIAGGSLAVVEGSLGWAGMVDRAAEDLRDMVPPVEVLFPSAVVHDRRAHYSLVPVP